MPWRKICTWHGQFIGFSAQRLVLVLDAGDEHVLAVVVPVAGALPQHAVQQLRGLHLLVAGRVEPPAQIGLGVR